MNRDNYSLEVLVNGRPVAAYFKNSKCFIEGRESTEYTLKFRNNSWKRVLAIFSVDGIEVIKGKAASESENGYVVEAFSSIDIKGYRIDDANVAAFKFGNTHRSYSNLVGAATVNPVTKEVEYKKDIKNNGVIGVRVFEEKVKAFNYAEAYKSLPVTTFSTTYNSGGFIFVTGSTGIFPQGIMGFNVGPITGGYTPTNSHIGTVCNNYYNSSTSASATAYNMSTPTAHMGVLRGMSASSISLDSSISPNFDLGTQWGQKLQDKVREVEFARTETSIDIEIYYASHESLESYGIDFNRTKQIFSWPSAFEDKKQYCKVPEGYNA